MDLSAYSVTLLKMSCGHFKRATLCNARSASSVVVLGWWHAGGWVDGENSLKQHGRGDILGIFRLPLCPLRLRSGSLAVAQDDKMQTVVADRKVNSGR